MSSTAVRDRVRTLASSTNQRLMTRLVQSRRVPRVAFQHYFIETAGLHSRVMLQNFYSTFWPHLGAQATARIDVFTPDGRRVGRYEERLAPFGSLFLEAKDLLTRVGAELDEGSLTIDLEPPPGVLDELASFPLAEPWTLRISTPFWMAYYDGDENYMYVHSIDRQVGEFYGVPAPVGWFLSRRFGVPGGSWRAGRLLDTGGLKELQIVAINHGAVQRTSTVGLFDAVTDDPVWTAKHTFAPHALQRFAVPPETLSERSLQVRVGVDPLATINGKPYVLMRYGDGPLSLHHG